MSFNPPKSTPSGKLMVIATLFVKPGKEEIVADLLKSTQKRALSNEEPGTLTYRLTRRVDAEGKLLPTFVVIEEYAGAAGVEEHTRSPPLQELFKAAKEQELLTAELSIDFLDEF